MFFPTLNAFLKTMPSTSCISFQNLSYPTFLPSSTSPATATLTVSFTVSSSTVAYYSLIRFVCSFDFRSFFNLSISNRLISSFVYSSVIDEIFNSSKPFFSSKQVDTLDMEASQEQGERKKETKLRNYPTLYLCTLKYRLGLF